MTIYALTLWLGYWFYLFVSYILKLNAIAYGTIETIMWPPSREEERRNHFRAIGALLPVFALGGEIGHHLRAGHGG